MLELILVRGLPGSGKTTLAKEIVEVYGHTHVEADMFYGEPYQYDGRWTKWAHMMCQSTTAFNLYNGNNVVVANTFIDLRSIIPYLDIARLHGVVKVGIVTCQGDYGSIHGVPEEAYQRMVNGWESHLDLTGWEDVIRGQ